jgi:hypothetical protein
VEIRKIAVCVQSRQKVHQSPPQPIKAGLGGGTRQLQGSVNRRITVQACPSINWRPYWKISKAKKSWDITQVVVCLPSKYKTLISNPSTFKKKILRSGRLPSLAADNFQKLLSELDPFSSYYL